MNIDTFQKHLQRYDRNLFALRAKRPQDHADILAKAVEAQEVADYVVVFRYDEAMGLVHDVHVCQTLDGRPREPGQKDIDGIKSRDLARNWKGTLQPSERALRKSVDDLVHAPNRALVERREKEFRDYVEVEGYDRFRFRLKKILGKHFGPVRKPEALEELEKRMNRKYAALYGRRAAIG